MVGCVKNKLNRLKKTIRTIPKLKARQLRADVSKELRLPTLPSLYILEAALCFCSTRPIQGIHQYTTRGRDNYRIKQHRTTVFGHLPSEVGVRIMN